MSIQHFIMDLDETLYSPTSQLWPSIRSRINEYLIQYAGIDPKDVEKERNRLYDNYGTTLRGLALEKEVDLYKYLDFVHNVPVEKLISRDQALISTLENIDCKKHIFTNASRKHADRVLAVLGVSQYFSEIISVENLHPWCKPQKEAFEIALSILNVTDNSTCLFIDDAPKNIETGLKLGLFTIQIISNQQSPIAHYSVQSFEKVIPILQDLKVKGNLENG